MIYSTYQQKILTPLINNEMVCIKKHFDAEVSRWKKGNYKIKALVLAEAPLSCKQYIYYCKPGTSSGMPGNFLTSLKYYYGVKQNVILDRLRIEGVFVLDMYAFPITTSKYDNDGRTHHLFNDNYLLDKLDLLRKKGLMTEETNMVFRYKKLIDRYFDMKKKNITTRSLDSIPFNRWIFGSLNITERPQEISPVMKFFI